MGQKIEIIDDDRLNVNEIQYKCDNGVTVNYRPTSFHDKGWELVGCQWPAEWSERMMGGPNPSDEEIDEWRAEAIAKGSEAMEEVFGDN